MMVITPVQLADVVKQINKEFKVLESRIVVLEAAAKDTGAKNVKKT